MICCNVRNVLIYIMTEHSLCLESVTMEFTSTVFARTAPSGLLDRLAIGLSGLCVAHCLTTAVLVAAFASAGSVLLHPLVHEMAGLAMALAAFALVRGFLQHGHIMPLWVGCTGLGVMAVALSLPHDGSKTLFTILGVLVVALGHDLNRRGLV